MCGSTDLVIPTHCTMLRRACGVWLLSHVSDRCKAEPAVGEAHSSLLKAALLSAETRRTLWPLQREEKNCALGRQKGVLKSWVSLWISQTNPQIALCPQRHLVCEVLWERSEAPLCGVSEFSAHVSSVLAHHSWVWVIRAKIGSVFHHGRLSCKITDEQGLSKQAAVTAA